MPQLDLLTNLTWLESASVEIRVRLGNGASANSAPAPPGQPIGEVDVDLGTRHIYGTGTVDPQGDSLSYQFVWGDGDTSVWRGPYPSGDTTLLSHKWNQTGTFEFRTRARDFWGELSDWSNPLTVVVSETEGCCTGSSVGNIDGSTDNLVTMGDLTVLIDHLFISLTPVACVDEANVDASSDGLVTMGDLTVLIDHLFISLNPLPACP